jgi:hypothetical protein
MGKKQRGLSAGCIVQPMKAGRGKAGKNAAPCQKPVLATFITSNGRNLFEGTFLCLLGHYPHGPGGRNRFVAISGNKPFFGLLQHS